MIRRQFAIRRLIVVMFLTPGFILLPRLVQSGCGTFGCAVVLRLGADVNISDEAALIIWDETSQTEHFIRKASFVSDATDFGFLVPTPSIPTLHEVGDHVFSYLSDVTQPRIQFNSKTEQRYRLFKPGTGFDFFLSKQTLEDMRVDSPAPRVSVISESQVAGYDAAILKADDAEALRMWLEEHGYSARPALTQWLDQYVKNGWYLTAFKFSKSAAKENDPTSSDSLTARAVRLTFQTNEPFYPYREPSDMRSSENATSDARLLRLFVLSSNRVSTSIGHDGADPTTTVWANQIDSYQVDNLLSQMRADISKPHDVHLSESVRYLTELEDPSSPRQGTDELYLKTASDQSSVERTPIQRDSTVVVYGPDLPKWPFWLLGLGLPMSAAILRGLRRRPAAK